ncbi:MAG: hypothetical protein JWP97_1143 [Labilithrix sp.]|nr:hypothetical protein [Labilithrix sp.]
MAAASKSKLLAHCRSLPHVTEDVKWGADLCFSIGGKMFAVFTREGNAATFSCKTSPEDFGALTGVAGIETAPYLARAHWIRVADPLALAAKDARALLTESYGLVKGALPKKLQAQLSGGEPVAKRATKA